MADDAKTTIDNIVAFSLTSKVHQWIINSAPFFKEFMGSMDPQNAWLSKIPEEQTFKKKYTELRNSFLLKNETYPGVTSGYALPRKKGVEIFSFDEGIKSFLLNENTPSKPIQIPEDKRIAPRLGFHLKPYVACSEKFLAIKQHCNNSTVYIYSPDGEQYLARFVVERDICQLVIHDSLLCIVEMNENGIRNLVIFNLEKDELQKPVTIPLPQHEILWLPPQSICFGKEYLIYTQSLMTGNQIHALPLTCLQSSSIEEGTWIKGNMIEFGRHILVDGDHFIEATFRGNTCDISEIHIDPKGFQKTEIAKDIVISCDEKAFRKDMCVLNGRIFFAYENLKTGTQIFSYDIILNKVSELFFTSAVGSNCPFYPRFLTIATNVYYLIVGFGNPFGANLVSTQCNLTTFTFEKL